jgi:hypothetical protein
MFQLNLIQQSVAGFQMILGPKEIKKDQNGKYILGL